MNLRSLGGAALLALAGLAVLSSSAFASQAVTLNKVTLRAGPLANSSTLGSFAPGTKVGVLWCGPEVKFCLVKYHGQTGWVPADDLAATASARTADEAGGSGKSEVGGGSSGGGAKPASKLQEGMAQGLNPNNGGGPTFTEVNSTPYQLIKP